MCVQNVQTGQQEKVYALLDSGADRDFISSALVERLGLPTIKSLIHLKAFGENTTAMRPTNEIGLESIQGSYSVKIKDVLVGDFPVSSNDCIPGKEDWTAYYWLKDIPFVDIEAKIEMLVSSAHSEATIPIEISKPDGREVRPGEKSRGPIARRTDFGWTLEGVHGKKKSSEALVAFV